MQIKITMRFNFTLVRMAIVQKSKTIYAGKDARKELLESTISRNINQYIHFPWSSGALQI